MQQLEEKKTEVVKTQVKKKKKKIAVLDIETTGFSQKKDCILEIGICELNLETKEITKLFDEIIIDPNWEKEENRIKQIDKINTENNISEFECNKFYNSWIFQNSDFKRGDMKQGKKLSEVFDQIQAILNKYHTCAYNQKFDFRFLEAREFNIPFRLRDPMLIATNVLKLQKPNGHGYKWPKVEECLKYFKFMQDNKIEKELHRAYSDCVQEAKIVLKLIELGKEIFP